MKYLKILVLTSLIAATSTHQAEGRGMLCAQRLCSVFEPIVGYPVNCCLTKVVAKLCEQNKPEIVADILKNLDFPSFANLLASVFLPECFGSVLVNLVRNSPTTFDTFPVFSALIQTDEEKAEAALLLKFALQELCRDLLCADDDYSNEDVLALILEKVVQVPTLLGRTLVLLVQDCADVACICSILESVLNDLLIDAYDEEFASEVCYWFAAMQLSSCITQEGSASLLASMMLNAFRNPGYDCDAVVGTLISTLCQCPNIDFSSVIARALELAQTDPAIAADPVQQAALLAQIAGYLQAA